MSDLSLPLLQSITRYLDKDSHKLLFATKRILETTKDDLFIWTNIYQKDSFQIANRSQNNKWIQHIKFYKYYPFEPVQTPDQTLALWIHGGFLKKKFYGSKFVTTSKATTSKLKDNSRSLHQIFQR